MYNESLIGLKDPPWQVAKIKKKKKKKIANSLKIWFQPTDLAEE